MRLLTKLTNSFFSKAPLEQFSTLLLFYYIVEVSLFNPRNAIYKIPFLFIAIVLFFLKQDKEYPKIFWASIFMSLGVDIIIDYTLIHNHLALFLYVISVVFLSNFLLENQKEKFLQRQLIWFFAIAMFFAGLHKLITPEFMNGSILSYYFVKGQLAGYIFEISPSFKEAIAFNKLQANEFSNIDPLTTDYLLFNPVSSTFNLIFKYSSWSIAVGEIVIGVLILLIPNKRIFYYLAYLLILGILITRYETGFLALLTIMLLFIMPAEFKKLKEFSFFFFLFCICLMVYNIGYA